MIALDLGTSRLKALHTDTGKTAVVPAPPLQHREGTVTQALPALLDAVDQLLDALWDRPAPVVLTAQRDTVVVGDHLVSWRDPRGRNGAFWDVVPPEQEACSLVGAVLRHWTGTASETSATWPSRLLGAERRLLQERGGSLARELPLGVAAGEVRGMPVFPTAGDKNCELLAQRVGGSVAGVSLGTAITLGTTVSEGAGPAVVPSRSARPGHIDLETGLLVGLSAVQQLDWLPLDRPWGPRTDLPLWLPHFAGALDGPAEPVILGLQPHHTRQDLASAWALGVVSELVRLRPFLERAAGTSIERLHVAGGASEDPHWLQLLADGFDAPVVGWSGGFAGCRGALDAHLLQTGQELPAPKARPLTAPEGTGWFSAHHERWLEAFERLRKAFSGHTPRG